MRFGHTMMIARLMHENGRMMTASSYATTWVFKLDERTTHMSVVATGRNQPPIPATPDSVRYVLSGFSSSPAIPLDVVGMLEVCGYLMETSVVHYEFAALAVEKALQALERMLRLAVAPSSRPGMAGLIKQLGQRVSLRPELSEFLTDMVRLRNDWVGHPQNVGVYPLVIAFGLLRHIHAAIAEVASLQLD